MLENYEAITRLHHTNCYNVSKFTWKWGTIDHVGIWAYGGSDAKPFFLDASFDVPKRECDKIEGWYCYIGPEPEFEECS